MEMSSHFEPQSAVLLVLMALVAVLPWVLVARELAAVRAWPTPSPVTPMVS